VPQYGHANIAGGAGEPQPEGGGANPGGYSAGGGGRYGVVGSGAVPPIGGGAEGGTPYAHAGT
jgi:hypothetical protein